MNNNQPPSIGGEDVHYNGAAAPAAAAAVINKNNSVVIANGGTVQNVGVVVANGGGGGGGCCKSSNNNNNSSNHLYTAAKLSGATTSSREVDRDGSLILRGLDGLSPFTVNIRIGYAESNDGVGCITIINPYNCNILFKVLTNSRHLFASPCRGIISSKSERFITFGINPNYMERLLSSYAKDGQSAFDCIKDSFIIEHAKSPRIQPIKEHNWRRGMIINAIYTVVQSRSDTNAQHNSLLVARARVEDENQRAHTLNAEINQLSGDLFSVSSTGNNSLDNVLDAFPSTTVEERESRDDEMQLERTLSVASASGGGMGDDANSPLSGIEATGEDNVFKFTSPSIIEIEDRFLRIAQRTVESKLSLVHQEKAADMYTTRGGRKTKKPSRFDEEDVPKRKKAKKSDAIAVGGKKKGNGKQKTRRQQQRDSASKSRTGLNSFQRSILHQCGIKCLTQHFTSNPGHLQCLPYGFWDSDVGSSLMETIRVRTNAEFLLLDPNHRDISKETWCEVVISNDKRKNICKDAKDLVKGQAPDSHKSQIAAAIRTEQNGGGIVSTFVQDPKVIGQALLQLHANTLLYDKKLLNDITSQNVLALQDIFARNFGEGIASAKAVFAADIREISLELVELGAIDSATDFSVEGMIPENIFTSPCSELCSQLEALVATRHGSDWKNKSYLGRLEANQRKKVTITMKIRLVGLSRLLGQNLGAKLTRKTKHSPRGRPTAAVAASRKLTGKRCQGVSIQLTGDYFDNEHIIDTDCSTIVDLSGDYVLDTRSQKNDKGGDPQYHSVPLRNGEAHTGQVVKEKDLARKTEANGCKLVNYSTGIRNNVGLLDTISHHQLINRVAGHLGLDSNGSREVDVKSAPNDDGLAEIIRQEEDIEEFLDGKTLEEMFPYETNIIIEGKKKLSSDLNWAGYNSCGNQDNNRNANDCDVEHNCKRESQIFNGIFATMRLSHLANQCAAIVRKKVGDWCFGFTIIPYRGGN